MRKNILQLLVLCAMSYSFKLVVKMRPKARGLAQHGDLPCWLEESDPAGCEFVHNGRSMPAAMTYHPACHGLGMNYF
jgi:hypothetical protein